MTPRYAGPVTSVAARSRVRRRNSGTRKPVASGSPYTIYPTANSGYIASSSSNSYDDAAMGAGTLLAFTTSPYVIGQVFDGATTWVVYQTFLDFDTSMVTGTVDAAALFLGQHSTTSSLGFFVFALPWDYGVLAAGDFANYPDLGIEPAVAYRDISFFNPNGSYTQLDDGPDNELKYFINQSGHTRLVLVSNLNRDAIEPYDSDTFNIHGQAHATLKPKLLVVTT